MPHPIEPSTLRILNPNGQTVGTGFLVAKNLVVTCAHVVTDAEAIEGDTIQVQFTGRTEKIVARVLPEFWSEADKFDVAVLQLDAVPAGVFPLRLGRASESRLKNDLYTFGYAIVADEQGIGGLGTFITLKQDGNFIQFRMHEANHGHSGAPIYDDQRGVVVGMIAKGHTELGRNAETTFAIPIETIWQVCPQLKPIIPPLPRRNPIVEGINLLPYDYDQRIQNFLTEYLGTDSHPVPFGGRDQALHMLDNWLADTTPYLLLAAPAGRGKSALLVRWLDSLSARKDLALVFVPVSIRFGTNMGRVLYAALAARLAFLHGDDVPASPETSTAVYRGLVSDYLGKPLANGRTLLVVLDGLDEAADWQAGADFMPSELPAGVRVVVSARFLAGDADSIPWLRRLNWEHNGLASAPYLTPLNQEGVRDVLFKMGCPLDELSRQVDIVAELYRLSVGDPLLVSLYVNDLWAKGDEVTRLKPEDLAGIQPGYQGYFDRWWDDQKKLWGKEKPWLEKHVRAVRNLLAGALGPLFRDDFQALEPELESDYIADALEVLQRFIIGDNQTQGYTFSHPKLGQYFWDALTPTEQAQVEGRFLAWGEQTLQELIDDKRNPKKKDEVPAYVVRNYGAHLARAKQPIEKWLPLIHHQQWAQAWFTMEGAYSGYLQDVQRVWEQCKQLDRKSVETTRIAPYISQQVRCGLIETSLHSLARNIPADLIWPLMRDGIWTLPQTWSFVRQMPESYEQSSAIIELLPHMDDNQLKEALEIAQAMIQSKKSGYRGLVLSELAQHFPEVAREALEAVLAIEDDWCCAVALTTLVQHLPKEELGRVLEAARAIQDEWCRASVLIELAQRLPIVSGEALKAAQVIQGEWLRADMLSELAQRLPNVSGEALKAARATQNGYGRAIALIILAQHLPELAGEALEAARATQNEDGRAIALSMLVQCLPEVAGEALEAARATQNEDRRATALSRLVQHLPEVAVEAFEVVRAIQDENARASKLKMLAQNLPERELGHVLEAIQAIQDERSRASVLIELAQRLPDVSGEALGVAQAIQDKGSRATVLSELAQYLPEMADEALAATRAKKEEGSHIRTLSMLDQHFLEAEQRMQDERSCADILSELARRSPAMAREMLGVAQEIQDEGFRATVLTALVERLPKGEIGFLLEAAQALQDERYRAWVLIELAQRLPERELRQVLKAAQSIQNNMHHAWVLSELAQRLPEGELEQVLVAARSRQDEGEHAWVLIELAQRLPTVTVEALEAAREIQDKIFRASMLSKLAQLLPEVAGEALETARSIHEEWDRVRILSELVQPLLQVPIADTYDYVESSLSVLSRRTRADLFSDLGALMPVIVHLGTDDTPRKIYQAIRDVTTRWP